MSPFSDILEFFQTLLDLFAKSRPGRIMDALTPWIILILGGIVLAIMVYAVWAVHSH